MSTIPAVALYIQNNQLVASCGEDNEKRFKTLPYLVAKIMDILAYIFPCFFLGSAEIRIDANIYYISRSTIKELNCQNHRPCHSANAFDNAAELKTIVKNYFIPDLHTIEDENVPAASATVPENNPQDDAIALTQAFLDLKKRVQKSSGYHLDLTFDRTERAWKISILAKGKDEGEIIPPPLSSLRECTCCHTCYEHTLKGGESPMIQKLNEMLAAHDMFGVYSLSGNLLLIPDTRKNHVRAEDFPHLYALNEEQLVKVFLSGILADGFFKSQTSGYFTHIGAHIGIAGNQTVPILHVRFGKVPDVLLQ